MPTINRLVLRLPDEFSGRGEALGRAIAAALATSRPPHAQARAALTVHVGDISAAASDTAIAAAVAGTIARRLGGSTGEKGPS